MEFDIFKDFEQIERKDGNPCTGLTDNANRPIFLFDVLERSTSKKFLKKHSSAFEKYPHRFLVIEKCCCDFRGQAISGEYYYAVLSLLWAGVDLPDCYTPHRVERVTDELEDMLKTGHQYRIIGNALTNPELLKTVFLYYPDNSFGAIEKLKEEAEYLSTVNLRYFTISSAADAWLQEINPDWS